MTIPMSFESALPKIRKFFLKEDARVYKRRELAEILKLNQHSKGEDRGWNLTEDLSAEEFIEGLLGDTSLKRVVLGKRSNDESATRYVWESCSEYEMALSLKNDAYLSHSTVVYLHGLNDHIPAMIYVNKEQSFKGQSKKKITQSAIDSAFEKTQRKSQNEYNFGEHRIVVLNGQYTGNLGVIESKGPQNEFIQLTSIERTLIDIAVRPAYSGGVYQVLAAYRGAKGRASVSKMVSILKELEFTYPYHQAIGFYLERADFPKRSIKLIEKLGTSYKFYLDYGLGEKNRVFDAHWSLFHPKGL